MRAGRLVELLRLLQARGRMTATQLAAELEVSQRTILRDIEELSAAGFPVYAVRGRVGGFELLRATNLDLPVTNPRNRARPSGTAGARARIRVSPVGRQLAALNGRPAGLRIRRPGRRSAADRAGWMEAWLPVSSSGTAVAEILALGAEAEVIEPDELRELVRRVALQIAELHAGAAHAAPGRSTAASAARASGPLDGQPG